MIVEEIVKRGSGHLISEIHDKIAWIVFNNPDRMNAMSKDMWDSSANLLDKYASDSNVRAIVLTGAGERAFVAGADISEFVGMDSKETKLKFTDNAVESLWSLTKPTIAMIDGFALGGGCEVACSCDIRIASERSKFGTPEINLGLIPGYGATQRLAKLVGYGKTLEMVMTGEMISASEARNIGLVNHVCDHEKLSDFTMNIANKIASKSVYTLKTAKRIWGWATRKGKNSHRINGRTKRKIL